MAAQSTYHIASLLEKMTSADKDYRFMATNDLMSELQKDSIKLDDDSERKVVRMLLKLLEDKNGEVQNLAVKCLGPLVNKVKDPQAETIVDTLCANMVSESELLRDVSSVAMKTVISELPPSSTSLTVNVVRRVTPKITASLNTEGRAGEVSTKMDSLDILADIILRFGPLMSQYHAQVQEALLPQLSNQRLAVGKRAIIALSHLVAVCSNSLFEAIIDYLVGELKKKSGLSTTRTYVAAVAAVSKASGHRFGEYLPKIVPLLIGFCEHSDAEDGTNTFAQDDELRESCLQAFEAFIFRCPKETGEFLPQILEISCKYLAHDPNYNYDDEEDNDESMNGEMETDEDEDEDDGGEYSDDDDMSWKVRRAAAKTLESLILSRRDLLGKFYREVGPLLISRFKEREENVKADIFHAYVALLRQTKSALPRSANILEILDQQSSMDISEGTPGAGVSLSNEQMDIATLLREQIPPLTKAINRQLREKSLKTRQSCFALLSELLLVIPGALRDQMGLLVPGIQTAMSDKLSNSNMKIETLSFLARALSVHEAKVFYPHVATVVPLTVKAVRDSFYKVAAEALSVIQVLARVLRPMEAPSCDFDFTQYVSLIYDAVYEKLKATDIDQEVKEKAIASTGQLISAFGDYLNGELRNCLPILLERLKNEMTRLTTVKALSVVAQSPLKIDLKLILAKAVPHLSDFLRKNQRVLKLNTLNLLDTLVTNYPSSMTPELLEQVLAEIPPLVSESDLQISQLSLRLVTGILKWNPGVISQSLPHLLEQIVILTQSPLLHGASLQALLDFLATLTVSDAPGAPSFSDLLDLLTGPVHQKATLNKQAYHSIAKCVATLIASKKTEAATVTDQLAKHLKGNQKPPVPEGVQLFSLLTLGEIGRKFPDVFSGRGGLKPEQLISEAFQSPSEEIKTAASYSLGGLAVGNLEKFLPFILKEINANPKRQYLLLHALKEVIGSESVDQKAIEIFKPRIGDIWKVLMDHAQCSEEGTRNVVAECLGKLCLMDPATLLPRLKEHINDPSPTIRTTVVTAVKFTVVDQPQAIDPLLQYSIGDFLAALTDEDLNVRRVALVTFNSAAHNKPSLVRDLLDTLLPSVYAETKQKKELVKEVEMGPFKHTVDGGLDLRKAAFECMYTLLETCLERLDVFEFLNHVEDGLRDHYDIKLLTYLMLSRLAGLCPSQVLQRLTRLVEPLKTTCNHKVKANAVKQEFEKQDELKRSALRAVHALQAVPDADKNPQMTELTNHIRQSTELNALYQSVERDPGANRFGAGDHAMDVDP